MMMASCHRDRDPAARRVFVLKMCALILMLAVRTSPVFGRPYSSGRVKNEHEIGSMLSLPPSQMRSLPEAGGDYSPLPQEQYYFPFPLFDPQCVACPFDCGRLGTTRLGRHCCLECEDGDA